MQKNWLLRLYQDTGMSGLCGKATYGNDTRSGHTCMPPVSISLILESLSKLLFT